MRVTVSHNKNPLEIKRNIDRGIQDVFKGLPVGPVQFTEQQHMWAGDTLNFSFNAVAGFMVVPIKGWVLVEERQVTIDVDLPPFLTNLIPQQRIQNAIEGQVKGLLT
jgi:hypothetical protein